MKLSTVRKEVIEVIGDSYFTPDAVNNFINQVLFLTASEIDIPDFKRLFTVTTSTTQGFVDLKSGIENFGGRVKRVRYNSAKDSLHIAATLDDLLDNYGYPDPDDPGDLQAVALEGRRLWYYKIPETEESLLVLCYINPVPLSRENDEADWMPEAVQREVLVNGACWKAYTKIEEEDSGQPMANTYFLLMQSGLNLLRKDIVRNRQSTITSCWRA